MAFSNASRSLDSFWLMLKNKLPRRTEDTSTQELTAPSTKRWIRTLEWAIAIGGIVVGILGFLLNYAPKLSVAISGSLQAANPMATAFVLANEGLVPVHDIVAACGAPQFKMGKWEVASDPDARFVLPESKAEILSPGHTMTLPCGHLMGPNNGGPIPPGAITKAEITIIVDYRPDWLPWHKTERFPWKAERTLDGGWHWNSLPR